MTNKRLKKILITVILDVIMTSAIAINIMQALFSGDAVSFWYSEKKLNESYKRG